MPFHSAPARHTKNFMRRRRREQLPCFMMSRRVRTVLAFLAGCAVAALPLVVLAQVTSNAAPNFTQQTGLQRIDIRVLIVRIVQFLLDVVQLEFTQVMTMFVSILDVRRFVLAQRRHQGVIRRLIGLDGQRVEDLPEHNTKGEHVNALREW